MAVQTRERILDTARFLFNQYGYHQVSMRQIADRLDISPGNLTYYFPHKADLVDARQKGTQAILPDIDPDRDPGYGIAVVLHHLLDRQRCAVAVRPLGDRGCCVWDALQHVLYQSCEIPLPGMPRGIQADLEGSLLCESYHCP